MRKSEKIFSTHGSSLSKNYYLTFLTIKGKFPLFTVVPYNVTFNEIVRTKNGARRGVLFWYDINGRIISDWYRLKSYTIWDAMTRRRTNGAVVIIAWSGRAAPESQAARARAIEFAQTLMPVLRRHLPS